MTEHDALAECAALLEIDDPRSPVVFAVVCSGERRRVHTTGSRLAAESVAPHLTQMTGQGYEVVARVRR